MIELDAVQQEAVKLLASAPVGIVTGGAGCHRRGQRVLRSDGTTVAVEHVRVGEQLLGYSGSRTVLERREGFGEMARIVPTKGSAFVVNLDHILTLVHSTKNYVVDVSVRQYLTHNRKLQVALKLLRAPATFTPRELSTKIPPYFLGLLLGDGTLTCVVAVTKNESAVLAECEAVAVSYGLRVATYAKDRCPTHRLVATRGQSNSLFKDVERLGLRGTTSGTKFIPDEYKLGSVDVRRQLLAGLIDTDGHVTNGCVDYVSKSQRLAEDTVFVARSLGLAAYMHEKLASDQHGTVGLYYRLSISGNLSTIPTRIARKQVAPRRQRKNVLRTGFSVERLPTPEAYYGFTLDGDGRYLLDDFTVTHNTGKTTVLTTALNQLHSYELCAPTGKASRRISQVTGRPARTIHRLLGWTPKGFTYGAGLTQEPLPTDVVIVDESSMIDVRLMSDLMSAIGRHTRIVFVGDANQLPPVGPGAPFRDFIASKQVPVVRLEKLYRAAAESWVCRNAPKVLVGGPLELDDINDFAWYQLRGGDDQIPNVVLQAVRAELATGTKLDDLQVLSPMKIGASGTLAMNAKLQPALNPKGVKGAGWKLWDDVVLHVGDRVMQTKNDYTLNVYNGEVGTVVRVDGAELSVSYDDDLQVTYNREQARQLQLSYAATIHKSQGSQYDTVIVVCHSTHQRMLTRQLFYTGITRAQRKVVIVGDAKGLDIALKTSRDDARRTRLVARICEGAA